MRRGCLCAGVLAARRVERASHKMIMERGKDSRALGPYSSRKARLNLGTDELGSCRAWHGRNPRLSIPSLPWAELGTPRVPVSGLCQQAAVPALPHPAVVPGSPVPLGDRSWLMDIGGAEAGA